MCWFRERWGTLKTQKSPNHLLPLEERIETRVKLPRGGNRDFGTMNQARFITLARPSGRQSKRTVVWVLSLVLSILFNVSSVAEGMAHNSHAHTPAAELSEHSSHSSLEAHGSHHMMQSEEQQSNLDAECACDDICCFSAASLNQVASLLHSPIAEGDLASRVRDYHSITLDLLLPPPNFS